MNALREIAAAPQPVRLKFTIGARTLFTVRRALLRVPLSLAEARSGTAPVLPPIDGDTQGYLVTSLPEAQLAAVSVGSGAVLPFVRQRYTRYFLDFTGTWDSWFAGLSSNARQGLRRKVKKIAATTGGVLDVRRFRTAEELAVFHPVARAISATTYQERLLGSGLPDGPDFLRTMQELAVADQLRAWLLYIAGEPAAYLCCPVHGDTVIYAWVGHDPKYNDWSPGAVLQLEAMQDLFGERRFATFDFTEGEGQHKRQFATGGVACVDLLLLRPTLANRILVAALQGFDGGVAAAKRVVNGAGLGRLAKRLRRGS
ncbi:GNAT family N-acetyltransferase [Sphingomonas psychrotolerans]|uniref:GNAT family N-acetyltransferase n=1 Tax=Sphingomonas psychrotolerans TaxID=1327635 RepID=A0ABU3N4M8_9SPHN|nr:GNAT family N-acetyltransferase [Sphingomonas psychrotolerans]MDT8759492.1 GNAT family N-acetyltransferase [Sphingomonas psychrotolerans]